MTHTGMQKKAGNAGLKTIKHELLCLFQHLWERINFQRAPGGPTGLLKAGGFNRIVVVVFFFQDTDFRTLISGHGLRIWILVS